MYQWFSWKMPEAFVWNTITSISLSQVQRNLVIFVCHKVLISQWIVVYRCEQNLDSNLHLSLTVYFTQIMRRELVF
jgi:hypothetical protein